jgi:hypothetical protein
MVAAEPMLLAQQIAKMKGTESREAPSIVAQMTEVHARHTMSLAMSAESTADDPMSAPKNVSGLSTYRKLPKQFSRTIRSG